MGRQWWRELLKNDAKLFLALSMAICILLATMVVLFFKAVNKPSPEAYKRVLKLDESVRVFEEKFNSLFSCVKNKACNLYGIEATLIATPRRDGNYNMLIPSLGAQNYTRGSKYRDTITWRSELIGLVGHESMISWGIEKGYKDWLFIEKSLGIHLDVGYGVYDELRDILMIRFYLPVFSYCDSVCGAFFVNATIYIDDEKYIDWQFMELNFSHLINKKYLSVKTSESGSRYIRIINRPALLELGGVMPLFGKIPRSFLNSTRNPIAASFHLITTNKSILEKYLNKLKLFKPLIEIQLVLLPYVSEISGDNIEKFNKLINQLSIKKIEEFLKHLRDEVVEKLYPNTTFEYKLVESSYGDWITGGWDGAKLSIYVGTAEVSLHNVTWGVVEVMLNEIKECFITLDP